LEEADPITQRRLTMWSRYHDAFAELEQSRLARRPFVPDDCIHNAHMYYLLLPSLESRRAFILRLQERGIQAVFHYVPLHSSPFGRSAGRYAGDMTNTDNISARLVRLPLWIGLEPQLDYVISEVLDAIRIG
jgi:dTDP-4-amino-4,6-dideoxygalactose transaminase